MREHAHVREQLILLVVGEPLEVPAHQLIEHVAQCRACREYLHTVEEAAHVLPRALPVEQPRASVRDEVMRRVREEGRPTEFDSTLRSESTAGSGGTSRGQQRPSKRPYVPMPAWTVVLFVALLATNLGVGWWGIRQEGEMRTTIDRYEADLRWLQAAEALLLDETPPRHRFRLEASDTASTAHGKAALYDTYAETAYLIVELSGLLGTGALEVWLVSGGEVTSLGGLNGTPDGSARAVFRLGRRGAPERLEIRLAEGEELVLVGVAEHVYR